MKTRYFTKVENKYVFNMSAIFWHLLIALASITMVIAIFVVIWSFIPPSRQEVTRGTFPEKPKYPNPVSVNLAELRLEEVSEEKLAVEEIAAPPEEQPIQKKAEPENTTGKTEYLASLNTLKTLIPSEKAWEGTWHWEYPWGERYWNNFHQERYRQKVHDSPGITDNLESSYSRAEVKSYIEKKKLMDGYIAVVKELPAEKREDGITILMRNVSDNLVLTTNTFQAIGKTIKSFPADDLGFITRLVKFGHNNPNDGVGFIDFVGRNISRFSAAQRMQVRDLDGERHARHVARLVG